MFKNISWHFFLLLTIFTFAFTFTYSQSIKFSPTEITERGFDYAKVIGQDDDGAFVLLSNFTMRTDIDKKGFKVRKYKVAYYDFNLQRKWSVLVQPGEDMTIDNVSFACDKVLIAYSKQKENNRFEYYLQWINNKGVALGGSIKNFEITFQRGSDYGRAEIAVSTNRERIFLMLHEVTNNNHQLFHSAVTDSTLLVNKLKVIDVPYKAEQFQPKEFDVSNNGDIALTGVLQNEDKRNKNKIFNGTFLVYTVAADNETANRNEFKLTDKIINECSISFDNMHQKLAVTGFYFDRDATIGSGVAYQLYDMKNGTGTEVYANAFEPQKDEELKGARNTNDGSLTNYSINKIIMKADGGAAIVAESYFITAYQQYDPFTQSTYVRNEYHYGNILVVSIGGSGEIQFSKLVKKQQESIDDYGAYSSFISMTGDRSLFIFFNKDINSNNEISGVTINAKGERIDKTVVRNVDHIWIIPKDGKQVSADEAIVPAYQKRKLVLAKINL